MARTLSAPLTHVAALTALLWAVGGTPAAADDDSRSVTVMTRNLYVGASLTPAVQATTTQELLDAVATIYTNSQRTNVPARAKLLAAEIDKQRPALVGLQEVGLWRVGPVGVLDGPATPAQDVALDFLPVLMAELQARGADYVVVRKQQELDLEAPAAAPYFRDIRLTSRDVILARRDVDVRAASSANFAAASSVPTPVGPFSVKASWVAADVSVKRQAFRFVTTHLEPFDPFVRAAQASELLEPGGPAVIYPRRDAPAWL